MSADSNLLSTAKTQRLASRLYVSLIPAAWFVLASALAITAILDWTKLSVAVIWGAIIIVQAMLFEAIALLARRRAKKMLAAEGDSALLLKSP